MEGVIMSQTIEQIRADRKRRKHEKIVKNRHAAVEIRRVHEIMRMETIAAIQETNNHD